MKKILKKLSVLIITAIFMCGTCPSSMAIKYTDGRFIKNTKVIEYISQIVMQHKDYKNLSDEYSIYYDRIYFSFSVKKETSKVRDIGIVIPAVCNSSVTSFAINLIPKIDLSSFQLVNLFLNSNEFNKADFCFKDRIYVASGLWESDRENEYDNKYSIMTDITEDNWREKFLDEENVIPDLCPSSLMFFELQPGEKFFVEGYEH